MKICFERNFKLPASPNFLICEDDEKLTMHIANLSDVQLSEIGREWTKQLISRAKEFRDAAKKGQK